MKSTDMNFRFNLGGPIGAIIAIICSYLFLVDFHAAHDERKFFSLVIAILAFVGAIAGHFLWKLIFKKPT